MLHWSSHRAWIVTPQGGSCVSNPTRCLEDDGDRFARRGCSHGRAAASRLGLARPGAELPLHDLNDSARRRYSYYRTPAVPSGEAIAPIQASLAAYLSIKTLTYREEGELAGALLNHRYALRSFTCPAVSDDRRDPYPQVVVLVLENLVSFQLLFSNDIDFALNEGVLGFHYSPAFAHRRYNGHFSRVARSSRVMLMSDALSQYGDTPAVNGGMMFFPVSLTGVGPVTLGDQIRHPTYSRMFDRRRHGSRINVSFVDGHVENRSIDPKGLDDVYLLAK